MRSIGSAYGEVLSATRDSLRALAACAEPMVVVVLLALTGCHKHVLTCPTPVVSAPPVVQADPCPCGGSEVTYPPYTIE